MKKIIYKALAVVFLVGMITFVIAQFNYFTQEEINNMNHRNRNLECKLNDAGLPNEDYVKLMNGEFYWVRNITCLKIRKVEENKYQFVEDEHYPKFPIQPLIHCIDSSRSQEGIDWCLNESRNMIQEEHDTEIEHLRSLIEYHQTKEVPDMKWFGDTFVLNG